MKIHPGSKKKGNENFDVSMGYFDEAKVCELVGKYILNQLKETFGLYRDDGLAVVKGLSRPEIGGMKKRVIKIFKDCRFKITIKVNLKIVSSLDVTFNLHKNTYEPYRKPDNQPVYINVNSNHPPTKIREFFKSIGKRLSELSCNKEIIEKAIPPYNDAFKKSGFKENLLYTPKATSSSNLDKKQRKHKIIRFNPPYLVNVFGKIR